MIHLKRLCTFFFFAVICQLCLPVAAEDWPHWRGPHRDGTTSELSGFANGVWNHSKPLWTKKLNASGESAPVVADGRIYTTGWREGSEIVFCLSAANGDVLWSQSYPAPARGRYAVGDDGAYAKGPLSAPEFDSETGYLYTLGCDGDLHCWDTRNGGKPVWAFNLYEKFGAKQRPFTGRAVRDYGYTTAPLIYGPWVVVEVGAKEGSLIAFDKRTGGAPVGTPAWRSVDTDPAGHSGGLVPMQVGGVPCLAVLTVHHLLVVRMDMGREGQTMAIYPFFSLCDANLVTPSVWKNYVVLSTHLCSSDDLVEVTASGAKRLGAAPHSEVGTPVFVDGKLYKPSGWLECWNMAEGKLGKLWQGENFGMEGAVIYTGDKRLIAQGNSKLAVYDLGGKQLALVESLRTGWIHPALAGGMLICKTHDGEITAY